MRAYSVLSYTGELQLFDHQQIAWVEAEKLVSFDMPEPDKPIIEYISKNKFE